MSDWRILATIAVLGLVSYALRSGGFVAAGLIREQGVVAKFLRLAPANLFIAFVTAACLEGGWPAAIACTVAVAGMAATRREWLALTMGLSAGAVAATLLRGL